MKTTFHLLSLASLPLLTLVAACGGGSSVDTGGTYGPGSSGSGSGGGGGSAPSDDCVISASVRALLEETVSETLYAAIDVSKNAGDKGRGFAIQLPGSQLGYVGKTMLNNVCPNNDMITVCKSNIDPPKDEFWKVHDGCVRFRCEAGGSNIALVDTFLTMQPKELATDKHKFTYDTTAPNGTATFDPNPFITWRLDLTDLAAIELGAKLAASVRIDQEGGELLEFSHTGSVAVSRTDADVSLGTLEMEFLGLLKNSDPLTVSAQVDAAGNESGEIKAVDDVIAVIRDDYAFDWQGACKNKN